MNDLPISTLNLVPTMAERKRDDRFSALSRDPRYRLPNKKEARTAVDPRFGRLFTDQDFRKKASVDRYGRKIKPEAGKKELEKLYRLEQDDGKKNDAGKRKKAEREVVGSSEEENDEQEEGSDEDLVERKDRARQGGFSESESEEESTSDEEESDDEVELADGTAGGEQTEDIPMGEVTRRIAAVNMDWDNIRASDVMAVASSFLPGNGRIDRVTVYPSEFGRERLEREELEGPPREIFASSKKPQQDDEMSEEEESDEEDEDERIRKQLVENQANEGEEFDTTALRQYQLERLRYYYAVIECDSKPAAKALYDSMDGREYLSTANFFDLRFIPDDVSFEDDQPKEECTKLPEGYKPNDFRTEALTHSKVRLTWDDDDTTRKEVQKRAFSRAEIDENDLQAYIGSDSSGDEGATSRKEVSSPQDRKAAKRETERAKMRAALGLNAEPAKGGKKGAKQPVGEMQITFTSGLSGEKDGKSVFENGPQDEESTRERYIRKEKERKQKRKERMKATRSGVSEGNDEGASSPDEDALVDGGAAAQDEDDAGFNDPFFDDPSANAAVEKKAKKAERLKKRAEKAATEEEAAARRKELELLMAEDQADAVRHFDMREIEKAEKEAKKKGKRGKKAKQQAAAAADGDAAAEFNVDTEDPRFRGLFESHEYAIDPTNPRYKATSGMKQLLEEGRKKRKRAVDEEEVEKPAKKKEGKQAKGGDEDLKGLVARLKGKGGK